MILTRLKLLCTSANKGEVELPEHLIEEFGEACKAALRKQFSKREKKFMMRMSQIGKDIRQQQCELLDLPTDSDTDYSAVLKFLFGDISEAIVITLLKASGAKIEEEQKAVSLDIAGIKLDGTYDVKCNGKIYDIKSASPYSFDHKFGGGFANVDETDRFGYVTQLYLYAEADKADVGGWIVMNKVTGELAVIEPPVDDAKYRTKHLQLAANNITTLLNTKSIDDIDKSVPFVGETHYGKATGKYVLHPDYTYFPYKTALWGNKVQYKANSKSTAKVKTKKFYVEK